MVLTHSSHDRNHLRAHSTGKLLAYYFNRKEKLVSVCLRFAFASVEMKNNFPFELSWVWWARLHVTSGVWALNCLSFGVSINSRASYRESFEPRRRTLSPEINFFVSAHWKAFHRLQTREKFRFPEASNRGFTLNSPKEFRKLIEVVIRCSGLQANELGSGGSLKC